MMKRIIALFLALIMTVGLLPTVALAAEGDAGAATAPADVIDGYYDDNNEWTKGKLPQSTVPGVQVVSKTAKPTSNPNEYEVTLEVVLKKTESQENPGSAATVLVLDHSGSMNGCAYCKSTTDTRGNYYHTEGCKYDKPNEWVRVTSEQSRMSAATKAVKDFIKTYSGRFDENGNETTTADLNLGRWVCLVWFNKKGGVTGGGDWVDVSNKSGYQMATDTSGWSAHDGTNLDCGLRLADYQLKQNTVAKISKNLKNVIVLSDGEPTFYLSKGVSIKGSIKIGNTKYYVHGSGKDCKKDTYNTTKRTAATLRNSASVYTVCFGASGNEIKDYDKNGNQKITVGNYLKQKIATQPKSGSNEKFAYDAADADALNTAFAAISKTIVSGLSTGTVKDTLPTGISSTVFGEGKTVMNWELNSDAFNKTEETKPLADGTKETVYTYTKTYTVTIDPDNENLVKTEDGYAPLNGKTTLTVKNSEGENVEIPFPIPAGKVTFPQTTYTLNYDLNGGDANTLITQQTATTAEEKHTFTIHNVTPTREGYTFAGWTESQTPTAEDTRYQPNHRIELTKANNTKTLYAQWTPATNTGYTVEHYLQKLEGDGYTKQETEELTGTTGENVNAAPKSYTGFTCDEKVEGTIKSGTIAADGSLVLKLYYTRNSYTVTYTDGVDGAEVFADDVYNNVAYGSTIPAFKDGTPTRAGYNFNGWISSVEGVTPSSAMPASNVTFTATWTEKNTATITYEVVGPDGCGSVNPANEWKYVDDLTAAKGSTAAASDGYRFVGWYDNANCTGEALSTDLKYVPQTPAEKWANATYYAKFEQIQVNVDLSPYVKKTLDVVGTLPTGFSETFKVNVTVDGQHQQQGTVTMTAAGTSSFNMPTVALTKGVHTIMVQEVVDGSTKNSNIEYDTNQKTFVLNIPTSGAAAPVQYGTTNSDGNFVAVEEPAFVTITNTYTEPKDAQVTNKEVVVTQPEGALETAVYDFEITSGATVLYPTGNGTTSNTLEVPYGTTKATLLYKITVFAGTKTYYEFDDVSAKFVYAEHANVAQVDNTFKVTFENGAEYAYVYVAVTHAISYDADGEYKARNFIGSQGAETTVTEKDPNKLTINFADFVKKELTATGSKTANDVKFRVIVNGMESPYMMYNVGEEEVSTYAAFDPKYSTVLNVNFASITGGNTETEWFIADNSIVIDQAGIYYFELNEEDGKRTGVTYDDSIYKVLVYVERKDDKLVVKSFDIMKDNVYVDGDTITFHNTIDTGKDDYYPIIIPTIINKDTGMLNKTDHFAYVIGYPDGTVHPNGQITRAEVATIFFRLLRDEVRDGAFTTSNSYSDVAYGKWYNNPISTMSALGIITGYPDGTFKPNKPITRAEFAAIAARFDETQSGKSATFSDVIGHWAAKEIGIAYANEWIKGYPDGTFKPDQNITRAEAMTMINRVLERKPESPADLLTNMNKWTDNMDTSKWYYLDVQEATNSHAYTRKTFNYELWRQMLPDPDWSRYER